MNAAVVIAGQLREAAKASDSLMNGGSIARIPNGNICGNKYSLFPSGNIVGSLLIKFPIGNM